MATRAGHPVRAQEETHVANRTYRLTEIVGTSKEGIDQAVTNGVARAGQTLRHLDWFEVTDIRGYIRDGEVDHYQVTMKIGFRLEDE
jgi:flavin-binding protein dodecin